MGPKRVKPRSRLRREPETFLKKRKKEILTITAAAAVAAAVTASTVLSRSATKRKIEEKRIEFKVQGIPPVMAESSYRYWYTHPEAKALHAIIKKHFEQHYGETELTEKHVERVDDAIKAMGVHPRVTPKLWEGSTPEEHQERRAYIKRSIEDHIAALSRNAAYHERTGNTEKAEHARRLVLLFQAILENEEALDATGRTAAGR